MKLRSQTLVLTVLHILASIICALAFAVLSLGGIGTATPIGLLLLGELAGIVISLTVYFASKM